MQDDYFSNEFHKRFTKTNEALKFIKELEEIDLNTITDSNLEKIIDERFPIFPFTSCTIPAGTELFRARLNINNKPFIQVKDIFIPPKEKIVTYGRANQPNEQIFYCASNFKVAAFEVIQNLRYSFNPSTQIAFLTIGIWKTKVDLHLTNIIHSPFLHKIREDINDSYNKFQEIFLSGHLSSEIVSANNLLCQFFSDQYTKNNIKSHFDYRISSLYARRLKQANSFVSSKYNSSKFDGINYPSVAMQYKGDNQAIFLESALNKIELENAIQVICANIDFENGNFLPGILHEANKIVDDTIYWKEEIYK